MNHPSRLSRNASYMCFIYMLWIIDGTRHNLQWKIFVYFIGTLIFTPKQLLRHWLVHRHKLVGSISPMWVLNGSPVEVVHNLRKWSKRCHPYTLRTDKVLLASFRLQEWIPRWNCILCKSVYKKSLCSNKEAFLLIIFRMLQKGLPASRQQKIVTIKFILLISLLSYLHTKNV